MVYYLVTVRVKPGAKAAFHKMWHEQSLPEWEKHGAKHVGSFDSFIGAADHNQIVRLFAFETMAQLTDWQMFVHGSESGTKLMSKLNEYLVSAHMEIVLPASYSPLQ